MEARVIFEGTSDKGNAIIICYPAEKDAQAMCDYINALSKEQTYIRFQGEQIDVAFEEKYLQGQLEKIGKKRTVQLFVFSNSKLIGIAGVDMKDKTESHEGVLGISLAKDFRGEGLGKKLMQLTLEEAKKELPGIRILTLGVFGDNVLAQDMYKKFGFQEYGRLPEGSLHRRKYVDHIYMYKVVRN